VPLDSNQAIRKLTFQELYEIDAVTQIGAHPGNIGLNTVAKIFARRANGWTDGKPLLFDRVTHIHRTHIGDGRIKKWRERADTQQRSAMTYQFTAFLARFSYSTE
jgi:hypothetical protein